MPSRQSKFLTLLQGLQHSDPRLYDALSLFGSDFYTLLAEIHPDTAVSSGAISTVVAGEVTGFTATLYPNNLRLTWNSLGGFVSYEIRFQPSASTDWDTATSLLTTTTNSADINPLTIPLVYGTYTFFIRASNSGGIESEFISTITFTLSVIGVPVVSARIIDNNVLLNWTAPSSQLQISYYNIYKDGTIVGTLNGNFTVIFEAVAGTYEYGVEAVDIVGNVGTRGSISATVNQPPDYELRAVRISDFSGTKTNACVEDGLLLVCVNAVETYKQHFDNHGWDGP